jgi:hypothetical protein
MRASSRNRRSPSPQREIASLAISQARSSLTEGFSASSAEAASAKISGLPASASSPKCSTALRMS